jgi:hypothetical protein
MAENVNPLVLPIKVDTSQVTTGVNALRNRLRELQTNTLTVSQNIAQTGNASTVAANGMAALSNQAASTSNALNQLANSSVRARTTLTSLSLIAQDAPFGFIAIQNNLPALIQQFGLLRAEAGSNGAALKQLGQSLVGPAGVFLAFSAVTAAVTFAIKEYGSLNEAFNQLTQKSNQYTSAILSAKKSLDQYNKSAKSVNDIRASSIGSVQDEILKVQTLANVISDSTTSDNNKKRALAELKTASEDYFGKLNAQKIDLDALNKAVGSYSESLIKNAVAQGLASEAASIFTEFLKQNQLAADVATDINKLKAAYPDVVKEAQKYIEIQERIVAQGGTGYAATEEVQKYLQLSNQLSTINERVKSTAKSYEGLKNQTDAAFKEASKFFELGKDDKGGKKEFTLGIDPQDLDAAFNLDKIISNVTKLGNTILDTNKPLKERQEALKELIAINPQVFSGLTLEKSGLTNLKTTVEAYTRSLQILIKEREFDARVSQINTQLRNAEIKKTEDAVKVSNDKVKSYEDQFENIVRLTYAQDQYGNSTDKITDKSLSFLKVLKQQQDISAAINKALNNIYGPGTAEENDPVKRVEELSKRIKQAKDNFENTIRKGLQQPFQDFFSTLIDTGKFSLDSFEGLFKDMLKRIAAQIVSAGIAKLISSILFPPGATADALAKVAAGNSNGGGIIGALISLFGGRRAFNDVNFDGLEGGGMQMSGQVVFVQRGSDLVGVLNRTNGTINRVG